jgi:hypothetical protein
MKKLFITISIIAVFFCFVPVFAAGIETSNTKKVMEDLKEDRRRAEEALSQDEQELKEYLEQAKEAESATEGKATNTTKEKSVRPGEVKTTSARPGELETSSASPEEVKVSSASPEEVKVIPAAGLEEVKVVPLRPGELETSSVRLEKVKVATGRPEGVARPGVVKIPPVHLEKVKIFPALDAQNKFFEVVTSVPVQRGLYFMIAVCFGFMCCYRIVIYKKKLAAKKKLAILDASLLAAVEHWRFSEGDFKRYQDKLAPLVDAQLLDINSQEFKKHFIKDLAITEILFQAALNEGLQTDPALSTLLGQYKLYLADLDKRGGAFSNALDNYRRSLTPTAGEQVPYADYYKDFLNLLMFINKQDDKAVFELYQRYLLVNKLVGKIGRGSAEAGEIQEGLDSVINKFKSDYNVIIKEEGIEPPKEEQITS